VHCNILCRRLEVQKVERGLPAPVAIKRRIESAPIAGTKLPTVKRSRPPLTTSSDKQLQPASLPQSSDYVGLSGNSGKLTCKVEWWKTAHCLADKESCSRPFDPRYISHHAVKMSPVPCEKKVQVQISFGI